jgi:DNA-binding transcriptional regulator YdaS (Cro superfamily)
MVQAVGKEVIARLVSKLGGVEKAAARLGIRPGLVQRFVDGTAQVPDSVLLKALDAMAEPTTPALRPKSPPPKGRPVI